MTKQWRPIADGEYPLIIKCVGDVVVNSNHLSVYGTSLEIREVPYSEPLKRIDVDLRYKGWRLCELVDAPDAGVPVEVREAIEYLHAIAHGLAVIHGDTPPPTVEIVRKWLEEQQGATNDAK